MATNPINIQLQATLNGTNGLKDQFTASLQLPQANARTSSGVLAVTTSAADLPYGSLVAPGLCSLQSLDVSTNTINFGLDASGIIEAVGQLAVPGDIAVFRIKPGASVRVQGSASTLLYYKIWDT